MSVRLILECDGCGAKAEGTTIQKGFSFGAPRFKDAIEDTVPVGWKAWDPYTFLCYCPSCWADVVQLSKERP